MITDRDFSSLIVIYPFLSGLSPYLSELFRQDAWQVNLTAGRTLYDVGGYCRSLLFPTAGSFNVICYQGMRQIQLYTVQPGDCCMLSIGCLLSDSPHVACAIIESDLSTIAISQDLFLQLLHESLEFRNCIFNFFAAGLALLMALIQGLAFERIDQRLAAVLLAKGDTVATTHQKLADELGSVREVISRNLKSFEDQGILSLDRGQILIRDRAALEKIADDSADLRY